MENHQISTAERLGRNHPVDVRVDGTLPQHDDASLALTPPSFVLDTGADDHERRHHHVGRDHGHHVLQDRVVGVVVVPGMGAAADVELTSAPRHGVGHTLVHPFGVDEHMMNRRHLGLYYSADRYSAEFSDWADANSSDSDLSW